jgi:hypothetical protein
MADFGKGVEPGDGLAADLAVPEAAMGLLADVIGQSGDFASRGKEGGVHCFD